MTRKRKRHTLEEIVKKLRDADAVLNAGKDEAAVLQASEVSQSTYERWRKQYGSMKAEQAKRLKEIVADLTLDNRMLEHFSEGNW